MPLLHCFEGVCLQVHAEKGPELASQLSDEVGPGRIGRLWKGAGWVDWSTAYFHLLVEDSWGGLLEKHQTPERDTI